MCTLPVSFPPDLDYSLVSVDRVGERLFLEQVHRAAELKKKNTAKTTPSFLFAFLPFGATLWKRCTYHERTNLCRSADGHEYFDGAATGTGTRAMYG